MLLTCASGIWAQDSGLGLGILVGDPTGLSAKLWLGDSSAIDAVEIVHPPGMSRLARIIRDEEEIMAIIVAFLHMKGR